MPVNFVDDNVPLPPPKSDRFVQNDPTHQWGAVDVEFVSDALSDIRTVLKRNTVDVREFLATGDGVTPDDAAITAAMAAVAPARFGVFGGAVRFGPGTYVCDAPLVAPGGVALIGEGGTSTPAVAIQASPTFNATSLLSNQNQTGGQEFLFLSGLTFDGNQAAGARCTEAVVSLGSLFANSAFDRVLVKNGSNDGLHVFAGGSPGGAGPLRFGDVWCVNNLGHDLMVEELAGNAGAMMGILFQNLTCEHQGSNKSAVYLKGRGNASNVTIVSLHVEQGPVDANGSPATGRTCLTLDGISDVRVLNFSVLGTPSTVSEVVKITNVAQNVGLEFGPVYNPNLLTPVVRDLKAGVTVGSPTFNLHGRYVTPDVAIVGGQRFTPTSTGVGAVFQDSAGTDRLWTNASGQLTGESINGAAVEVVGDATNNRVELFLANATSGITNIYGTYFPPASGGVFRMRSFTGGQDAYQVETNGNVTMLAGLGRGFELPTATLSSNQNNFAPTGIAVASVLIINASAAVSITGIVAPTNGKELPVYNNSSFNVTLSNLSSSSSTANQIVGRAGADTVLTPKTCAVLHYSSTLSKWIILGDTL